MVVVVRPGAAPTLGNPIGLVTRPRVGPFPFGFDLAFAVSPYGRRVLAGRYPEGVRRSPGLAVVQNWAAEFRESKRK